VNRSSTVRQYDSSKNRSVRLQKLKKIVLACGICPEDHPFGEPPVELDADMTAG